MRGRLPNRLAVQSLGLAGSGWEMERLAGPRCLLPEILCAYETDHTRRRSRFKLDSLPSAGFTLCGAGQKSPDPSHLIRGVQSSQRGALWELQFTHLSSR